jgi:hypothetical protein
MSFADFARAIASPALKGVAAHWNDVRGPRAMPGWNDIKPHAIAAQLPIVWAYRYDPTTDSFTGRLAGEHITAIFGKSIRGLPMTKAYPESEYPALFARTKRVVIEPCFMRGRGIVFRHLGRFGTGERIVLPLAEDGVHGDGVIGATEYNVTSEPGREILAAGEVLEWFKVG